MGETPLTLASPFGRRPRWLTVTKWCTDWVIPFRDGIREKANRFMIHQQEFL
ncbi:hypothetical protein [Nostoc sp.]|uniref:hypothetical protein n=1 Tax=Nostoc sp. TaxID=1180 RepID=UPI002FF68389